MTQAYSNPDREHDETALPDIEIFQLTAEEVATMDEDIVHEFMQRHEFRLAGMNSRDRERLIAAMIEENGITGGWCWQSCFPGCLPDGPPIGPFATAAEAKADAQSDAA